MQVLSFSVEQVVCKYQSDYDSETDPNEGREYIELTVRPLVNGVPLIREAYVFDAGSVMARECIPSEFDPFTCSCGVAGCAGIHESVVLAASETEVSWTFPEEPFRKDLNPAVIAEGAPLVLRFEAEQYQAALNALEAELLALESSGQMPIVLPPDSHPELDEPFSVGLAKWKVNTKRWIARIDARNALFGPLMNEELVAEFPDGHRQVIHVVRIAEMLANIIVAEEAATNTVAQDEAALVPSEAAAETEEPDDTAEMDETYETADADAQDEETDDHVCLRTRVVPAFLANRDAVLVAARSMPWSELEYCAYRDYDATPTPVAEVPDVPDVAEMTRAADGSAAVTAANPDSVAYVYTPPPQLSEAEQAVNAEKAEAEWKLAKLSLRTTR